MDQGLMANAPDTNTEINCRKMFPKMVQIKISKYFGLIKSNSKENESLSQTFYLLLKNQSPGVYLKLYEYPGFYFTLLIFQKV